jgi:hypothetical protein
MTQRRNRGFNKAALVAGLLAWLALVAWWAIGTYLLMRFINESPDPYEQIQQQQQEVQP